jgi:hypothetical protein
MVVNNMSYQNGKIYCIRNTIDDDIYVGSTTQPLCKRMVHHRDRIKINVPRSHLHQKMYDVGVEHFYIELIENCPCENKEELCKREGFFIREMGTLNSYIAGRSRREHQIDNRLSLKAYKKQYNDTHKTEQLEYRKHYYETNKDLISVKGKEYRETHKEK